VGTGGLGDGSPPTGSRGIAPVMGVWGRSSHKPDIYRQFAAVKCFSSHVCCRVRPPSPLPSSQKNSSDLRESHDPTRPGQDGHGTRAHLWLRYCTGAEARGAVPIRNPLTTTANSQHQLDSLQAVAFNGLILLVGRQTVTWHPKIQLKSREYEPTEQKVTAEPQRVT